MSRNKELPQLPSWLKSVVPEYREPIQIAREGEQFTLSHSQLEDATFTCLESAHDAAHSLHEENVDDVGGVRFSGEVPEGYSTMGYNHFITNESSRMLFFSTDRTSCEFLQLKYQDWLETSHRYEQDAQNFENSYKFVDHHPIFWTRSVEDKRFQKKRPYSWKTEGYLTDNAVHYLEFENNTYQHVIEAGEHVEPEYVSHYLDIDLIAIAYSYENAVVKLAEKIYQKFDHDGSERTHENVSDHDNA